MHQPFKTSYKQDLLPFGDGRNRFWYGSLLVLMLAVPYHTTTAFAYTSYELTPNIKASLQLNYGVLKERNSGQSRQSTVAIPADNAYLPASIANQFGTLSNGYNAATGIGGTITTPTQSVTIGTLNINNLDLNKPFTVAEVCNALRDVWGVYEPRDAL